MTALDTEEEDEGGNQTTQTINRGPKFEISSALWHHTHVGEELGVPSKAVVRALWLKETGRSRFAFDGGGKEPSTRCGYFTEGFGSFAGHIDRHRRNQCVLELQVHEGHDWNIRMFMLMGSESKERMLGLIEEGGVNLVRKRIKGSSSTKFVEDFKIRGCRVSHEYTIIK